MFIGADAAAAATAAKRTRVLQTIYGKYGGDNRQQRPLMCGSPSYAFLCCQINPLIMVRMKVPDDNLDDATILISCVLMTLIFM